MNGGICYARTTQALHIGAGEGTGSIDLPVIRQADIPIIPSSALKGALRWATEPEPNDATKRRDWNALFGPDFVRDAAQTGQTGLLAFGDAHLLAMPVPSMCGLMAWATCPKLLWDYHLAASDCGVTLPDPVPEPKRPDQCIAFDLTHASLGDAKRVILKDLDLVPSSEEAQVTATSKWQAHIAERFFPTAHRAIFDQRLVVVSDLAMHYLLLHCTDVRPRIRRADDGTVASKALWFEEYICAHTLFYFPWWSQRIRNSSLSAESAASWFLGLTETDPPGASPTLAAPPQLVQVGGKASIGKGWLALSHSP